MNENITSVVINGRSLVFKNGCVLVICGTGSTAGAFWKKIEDCSNADFDAAKETDTVAAWGVTPWGDSLDDVIDESYKHSFNTAVDYLAHCKGEDFIELVRYARAHGNKFFNCVKELVNIANANVAYDSAIVKLARPLGNVVERKAFELFELALEDKNVEDFLDMWKSLQTISYFCD